MNKEAAIAGAGVPPLVADLARLVGRIFYRDEHAVVLDRLSRELLVREDDLQSLFGLADKQVRRILGDLLSERIICSEEVTERVRMRGRDAPFDVEAKLAELVARSEETGTGGRKRSRVVYESDDEEDSEEEGGSGGVGPRRQRRKATAKVSTTCYYLSPRYFVDVIKLRLALMRKHLEGLERFQGSEAMYRCTNSKCIFECSLMEAEQRRASVAASTRTAGTGAGTGIGSVRGALFSSTASGSATAGVGGLSSSAGAAYDYTCPLCGSALGSRRVESVSAAAARLQSKLADVLRSSGLLEVLKSLDAVPLGANRPSDSIKAGLLSLHGPKPLDGIDSSSTGVEGAGAGRVVGGPAKGGKGGSARPAAAAAVPDDGAAGAVSASRGPGLAGVLGAGRVFFKQAAIVVEIDGQDGDRSSSDRGARTGAVDACAPTSVAASTVPDFLLTSHLTGASARTFGFMRVDDRPDGAVSEGGQGEGEGWSEASAGSTPAMLQRVFAAVQGADPSQDAPPQEKAKLAGDAGWVFDSNINADLESGDNTHSEAAAAAAQGREDNAAMWAALFSHLTGEQTGAGEEAGEKAGEGAGDDEWEDV